MAKKLECLSRQARNAVDVLKLMKTLCSFTTLPFGTVVLATEHCHLFVVEEGHTTQRPSASAVHVAANVFCWGKEREDEFGLL